MKFRKKVKPVAKPKSVFEAVVYRELDGKAELEWGPEIIFAHDQNDAHMKAIIESGIDDSEGVKVLVRPFVRSL